MTAIYAGLGLLEPFKGKAHGPVTEAELVPRTFDYGDLFGLPCFLIEPPGLLNINQVVILSVQYQQRPGRNPADPADGGSLPEAVEPIVY